MAYYPFFFINTYQEVFMSRGSCCRLTRMDPPPSPLPNTADHHWLAPIHIPLRPSRIHRRVRLGCWSSLLALPWLLAPQAILGTLLLLPGLLLWQQLRRPERPRAALLREDSSWELIHADGRRTAASLKPMPLVHPWLTLLRLESATGNVPVAIWPDSLPIAQRRHLRARLLLGNAHPGRLPPPDRSH